MVRYSYSVLTYDFLRISHHLEDVENVAFTKKNSALLSAQIFGMPCQVGSSREESNQELFEEEIKTITAILP